jgi:putative transposon-encoded protein
MLSCHYYNVDKVEFKLNGYAMLTKDVKQIGTGAHALIPKKWAGKKVAIILLECD